MNKIYWVFILIMLPSFINAEKGGLVSGEFLSLGAGARLIAMGETGTASVKDSYASWWNPAALTRLKTPEIALMHNEHFEGINQQYLAIAYPASRYSAALNLTRLAIEPFSSYDGNGNALGETQASDLSLGLAFGLKFKNNLSLGATGKWLQERLDTNKAQTIAGDFGMLYEFFPRQSFPTIEALRLGASYSNLSRGLKFERDRFSLPETLRVGASSQHQFLKQRFSLSLEGVFPKKSEPFLGVGAEWQPQDFLAFRLGWRGSQDMGSGLRLGFGIKIQQFSLDYAWAGFGDFGGTHRISLKIQLGNLFGSQKTLGRQKPMPSNQQLQEASEAFLEIAREQNGPASWETTKADDNVSQLKTITHISSRLQNIPLAPERVLKSNFLKPGESSHRKTFPRRTLLGALGVLGGGLLLGLAFSRKLKN